MTDLRDAARQALKSLRGYRREISCEQPCDAERALEAALEQPEQEPLAWLESPYGSIRMNATMRFQFPPQSLKWKIPLYTHPPRREWRGLTDEEMVAIAHRKCWEYRHSSDPHHSHTYKFNHSTLTDFRYAIEAALKERNV